MSELNPEDRYQLRKLQMDVDKRGLELQKAQQELERGEWAGQPLTLSDWQANEVVLTEKPDGPLGFHFVIVELSFFDQRSSHPLLPFLDR